MTRADRDRYRERRRPNAHKKSVVLASFCAVLAWTAITDALADRPKVVSARIILLNENSNEFQVTVVRVDTSWDHYADRWETVGPEGKILGNRVLWHLHIGEPLFLSALRPVTIPPRVEYVIIRVHYIKHGYGHEKLMALPTPENRDTGVK